MTTVLALEVRDAAKRFGTTEALRGADLSIARGQLGGLLGPNGAGKTTLLRAIAGRVRLDRGAIALFGAPAGPEARRRLGVVPQELALYPKLTARENLTAFARFHRVPRDRVARQVEWALGWTGLSERADARAETFSGGMKRRLNLACGVLHEPELVLLDEPTVGVDPQSRQRIWEMLSALRERGASLLLTTHQLDEAEAVCNRITIIDGGRAVASGSLDELIDASIGREREVVLRLDRVPGDPSRAGLEAAGLVAEGATLRGRATDLARALPEMLAAATAAGVRVDDVRVVAPSLQAVFLHLTGRALRE